MDTNCREEYKDDRNKDTEKIDRFEGCIKR